jgi:hypothetical protein
MTTIGYEINPAAARRRQIRAMQRIFAGAATIATLALFSAAQPGDANNASGPASTSTAVAQAATGNVIAVDDDTNPSSGDIFTQNAQDQSTASGAGT